MPEISRFLGITITMYFNDHMPPHFHAEYNNEEAAFAIESLSKIAGSLPPRITGYVIEWASASWNSTPTLAYRTATWRT